MFVSVCSGSRVRGIVSFHMFSLLWLWRVLGEAGLTSLMGLYGKDDGRRSWI